MLVNKIGIIGRGVVGGAIISAIGDLHQVKVYVHDIDPNKSTHTIQEMFECDGIFICTPTPQDEDGTCDTSALEDVLKQLEGYRGVIISKSTAPIDVYQKLNQKYYNLVHAPEFLTEANANSDFAHGTFSFIGGNTKAYMKEAERIIRITQHDLRQIIHCSIGEAALAKYTINTFLAIKVAYMNEMYILAQKMQCNYDKVSEMVKCDTRIGTSHMAVPGSDGNYGFGGMCFPKDTSALLQFAKSWGIDLKVLDGAISVNKVVRPDVYKAQDI
jgi:UDPglucose 6-dehydrogenase